MKIVLRSILALIGCCAGPPPAKNGDFQDRIGLDANPEDRVSKKWALKNMVGVQQINFVNQGWVIPNE